MKLSEVTKKISALQGFIGILPGLAVIIAGLGILPGRELLFRSFVVSVLFVVTIVVLASKDEILGLNKNAMIRNAAVGLLISGVSLLIYLILFDLVVVKDTLTTDDGSFDIELYLPLFPKGQLAEVVSEVGRFNLVSAGLIEQDIESLKSVNYSRYAQNDVVFIILYLLIVVPLNVVLSSAAIVLLDTDFDE